MPAVHCSSLWRVMRCSASYVVRFGDDTGADSDVSNFGTAFHRAMELLTLGKAVNHPKLAADFGLSSEESRELRSLTFVPQFDREDWSDDVEVSFVLGDEEGVPVLLTSEDDPRALLAGRIDLMRRHNIRNSAVVVDYKSGFRMADHWQTVGYAFGVLALDASIQSVESGMFVYPRLRKIDHWQVDAAGNPVPKSREELLGLWSAVAERCREAKALELASLAAGDCRTGSQCDWCAAHLCPAWRGVLSAVLDGSALALPPVDAPRSAQEAWVKATLPKLAQLKGILADADKLCKSVADAGDVPLDSGEVYHRSESIREKVDAAAAWSVLMQFVEGDLAKLGAAVGELPKSFLYDFAKVAFSESRGKYGQLLTMLQNAGAMKQSPYVSYEIVKANPKPEAAPPKKSVRVKKGA